MMYGLAERLVSRATISPPLLYVLHVPQDRSAVEEPLPSVQWVRIQANQWRTSRQIACCVQPVAMAPLRGLPPAPCVPGAHTHLP